MRRIYFHFIVGASAPHITFIKGITIPLLEGARYERFEGVCWLLKPLRREPVAYRY
jgi:hypothetical protein